MSEESGQALGKVVLGRYRIVRRLAQGGMGVVYLARIEGAEGFVRPAVIKRMLPEFSNEDEHVRMFVREARILADLRHPGVVSVLDFAAEKDAYLMALDYVDGFNLSQWLRYARRASRRIHPELAVFIVARVLDALHYVHTRTDEAGESLGIVHRDVSPSNILVDREGRVRILDFGVARTAREVTHSEDGEVSIKGKLAYLAPELLQADPPSVASDVFACAVTLHELLVGTNEFRDRDPTETMRRVLLNRLSAIEGVVQGAPRGIDAIIRRGSEPEPHMRFETAGAMAAALDSLLAHNERELTARLQEAARRDFEELPRVLGVPPLDDLEKAWREAAMPSTQPPPRSVSDPPTLDGIEVTTPPSRSGASIGLVAGFAVLAVAGLALGGYAVWKGSAPSVAPQVVVVDQRSLDDPSLDDAGPADPSVEPGGPPDTPSATDAGAAATGDPPPTTGPDAPAGRRRGAERTRDPALELSRRFDARRGAIHRCFTQHAAESQGRPQLSVRFSIDARGSVTAAELSPASVAATPLGRCLLRVARSVEFGPQPRPISFRIPITVSGS